MSPNLQANAILPLAFSPSMVKDTYQYGILIPSIIRKIR
jgi:hypothetical protein